MDASQFALWLQGFAELNTTPPTPEQWQSIREHLQLVFTKVTPEVKRPVIDLTSNKDVQKKVDEERLRRFYDQAPTPLYPHSWGDKFPPGTIIC